MRLIDVDKLLKALHNTPTKYDSDEYPLATQLEGMAFRQLEILDLIEKQPIVQEWIPCSNRLPQNDDMVLVSCEAKNGRKSVNRAYFDGKTWHGSGSMAGVKAWMPLPEPYKEKV